MNNNGHLSPSEMSAFAQALDELEGEEKEQFSSQHTAEAWHILTCKACLAEYDKWIVAHFPD